MAVALLIAFGYLEWGDEPAGGPISDVDRPGAVLVAEISRVVDGDTVIAELEGRKERVRYIGIDTPESVQPGHPVECFGKEASARNETLVGGRSVRLLVGEEARDRYGRLLAYVYLGEMMVNAELVRDGYAETLTIAPNDRFAALFGRLESAAKAADEGIWGACR